MTMANTGIYTITHIASGKRYVGSAVNFTQRWAIHRCLLNKRQHHSPYLQAAWNKYGEAAFEFKPILICSRENLLMYEQRCLDGFRTHLREFGFNGSPKAGSQLGLRHSDASRAKIRAARAKQVFSPETRALWSKNRTGRKMPAWFGSSVSTRCKGRKMSAATRAKMSAAKAGKVHSLAQIEARTKLTQYLADDIRVRTCAGESRAMLAVEYGVSVAAITSIVIGRRWSKYSRFEGGRLC